MGLSDAGACVSLGRARIQAFRFRLHVAHLDYLLVVEEVRNLSRCRNKPYPVSRYGVSFFATG
jgi:hypothetical protein